MTAEGVLSFGDAADHGDARDQGADGFLMACLARPLGPSRPHRLAPAGTPSWDLDPTVPPSWVIELTNT